MTSDNGDSSQKSKPSAAGGQPRLGRLKPGPLRRLVIAVVVIVVLMIVGTAVASVWTDTLWFQELGHTNVYWTPVWAHAAVGAAFAVIFFAVLYGSMRLARLLSPKLLPVRGADEDDNIFELATRRRWPGWIMLLAAAVVAVFVGIGYASRWETIFLYFGRSNFGYADPIFHKDASFYVFTLPLLQMLLGFVALVLFFTFVATALVYVLDRAVIVRKTNRISLAPHVKAHLSVILAVAMLAKGVDYMVQRWSLNLQQHGAVHGASYTDVHARMPVLFVLAIVSVIAAFIFIANIRYRGWKLPAIAIGIMLVFWLFAGKIYPYAVQGLKVAPNEYNLESSYISNNIQATRVAYGIDKISTTSVSAKNDLTSNDTAKYSGTFTNVRIWEPSPALRTYSQIQSLRQYYTFKDVDVDRYTVNGKYQEVLISARELDQTLLSSVAQTWVNKHQTYTHGYGFVMSPVNEATGDGLPVLTVKDIPPQTSSNLKITRPEIYYGQVSNDYVLVKTGTQEFDYPKGDTNAYTTYAGKGGVSVGSYARKLAFAWRFGATKLLFSSTTSDSRILFRRNIADRVEALAPFLQYDQDPYLVLRDDGSLVWMLDAYTTTSNFPYSQPRSDGTNYIRNPIKVVVDAYNGSVTFYQIDSKDPIANAWGKIYKGLFTPGDKMPADLRAHMRYPEDMYTIQANMLTTYHMTDSRIFYNKEDVWQIPKENTNDGRVDVVPYYQMISLAGEKKAEFTLVQPLSTIKNNMASVLIARQDGNNYGKLVLIDMPKDTLVYGTEQVENRIANEPTISSQLTLWNQQGSKAVRGNLLAIPVGQSIMYFEPLYLESSEANAIPQLTRVIVVYGDMVVMEPTLAEALNSIFSGQGSSGTTTTTTGGGSTTTTPGGGTTTTTVTGGTTTTISSNAATLVRQANQYYQAAVKAQQKGDWAEYGRQLQLLGQVLDKLAAAQK